MVFATVFGLFKRRDFQLKKRDKSILQPSLNDVSSEDTSLSSTLSYTPMTSSEGKNFQYIEGRRYIDEDDVLYLLPNDHDESDRLHQQHWVVRHAFQCNYHAPIKEELEQGIHVLDSGCGPATWTLDMAEAYPNSKFTGLDVSCVFPEIVRPPNVQFQICNIAKEIPFADDTFDYFHQRMLVLGLTKNGWNKALENAYRVLKPGGIIELVEPIVRFHCMGPHLTELQKDLGDLLVKKEMVHDIGSRLGHLLRRTGFKEIKVVTRPIPVNHSSKIGELYWQDLYHGYKNLRPMMAVVNPAYNDPQVYLDHLDLVAEECTQMRTNVIFHVTFAQKPFTQ